MCAHRVIKYNDNITL
ncbi:hypothetical protein [Plasmodium yoelii yoelii]|uniref:Uncharacterized protein n=1 Tax=Plasmodium yoelii yoelii TaxID=73239 RepID=Q7R923_PLAYO|nr:hypothetical protein [Plasmodium yoelii yoelii]